MTRNMSGAPCGDARDAAMLTQPERPEARIIVQPASTHRFRYKSEGRCTGSIAGVENNSYPTIEISGGSGKAVVVISCVTKDKPYRPHPHGVIPRDVFRSEEEVKKGACKMEVHLTGASTQVSFNNIGIQSTTRNEVKEMLRTRKAQRVDPFNNGFSYTHMKSIDLNAVRLCFQVVIVDESNKPRYALPPLVSCVIRDKKTVYELFIARTSHCDGPAAGGTDMILLCKKVKADDIAVVFLEKSEGRVVWEANATDLNVHQNYAIAFKTPPYRDLGITTSAQVCLQLKQVSNNARSSSVDFKYIPSPNDRLKSILRKPLPAFLQSFVPMEIAVTDSLRARDFPGQLVNTLEVIVGSEQKPLSELPIDLIPLNGPGPSRVDCLPRAAPLNHQNYLQLDHEHRNFLVPQYLPQTPSLIESPHLGIDDSVDVGGQYSMKVPYVNGHGGHLDRDTISPVAPSTSKLSYAANEQVRLNSDHFSDICDTDLSDSLSGLSLKDLIGTAWKPDSMS